jgi:hypothetical protein
MNITLGSLESKPLENDGQILLLENSTTFADILFNQSVVLAKKDLKKVISIKVIKSACMDISTLEMSCPAKASAMGQSRVF